VRESRPKVDPRSGTVGAALKLKTEPVLLTMVRVQVPLVGANPFPLVIPVPVAVEDPELVVELVIEVELKVKPLTVQKKEGSVTMVRKLFSVAVTVLPLGANVAKSPESLLTHGSPTIVISPVIR
jgi:hypothetical protein